MQVELGNDAAHELIDGIVVPLPGPQVTCMSVDDSYGYEPAESAAELARDVAFAVLNGQPGITHLPGQEAALAVVQGWPSHSSQSPSWVWSDNAQFATLLGHYFRCPVGRPDNTKEQ